MRISFSEKGFVSFGLCDSQKASTTRPLYFNWDEIEQVKFKGNKIYINKKFFVSLNNSCDAKSHVALIQTLKGNPNSRLEILQKYFKSRCDIKAAKSRLKSIKTKQICLQILSAIQFVLIFIALPIFYALTPTALNFAIALFGGIIFSELFAFIVIILYFNRLKNKTQTIFKYILMSPFLPIFTREIFVDELKEFTPITISLARSKNKKSLKNANDILRQLTYLILKNVENEEAKACIKTSFNLYKTALIESLKALDVSAKYLETKAITNIPQGAKCYCPRCQNTYLETKSTCPDCACTDMINLQ